VHFTYVTLCPISLVVVVATPLHLTLDGLDGLDGLVACGDQYRGKGYMEYLRKCRESATVKRKHDESCEDHAALGGVGDLIEAGRSCDAWNYRHIYIYIYIHIIFKYIYI